VNRTNYWLRSGQEAELLLPVPPRVLIKTPLSFQKNDSEGKETRQ